MAFLDLSAASDTMDKENEILLSCFSFWFGTHGSALTWFRSYLTTRTEYILFNGVKSPVRTVIHSVLQGSVLGPLLFLLYTAHEKISVWFGVEAHFYTDNSQTYVESNHESNRQLRFKFESGCSCLRVQCWLPQELCRPTDEQRCADSPGSSNNIAGSLIQC